MYMKRLITTCLIASAFTTPAFGHGESVRGVGGAGVNAIGGEIADEASVSLRYDLRSYALFADTDLLAWQQDGQNVHQHQREHTLLLGGLVPISAKVDIGLLLQASRFENFTDNGDAFALANATLSRTDVSQGLGDFLLLGRYQVYHRGVHDLAVLGGFKLPTGRVRNETNQGEIVGTHNQPGSGSFDAQAGFGYSGHAGEVNLTADVLFRINTEGAKTFRAGNSIQTDVAAAYPIGSLVPSLELNAFFQERDIEADEVKSNSGGRSLFATPAIRGAFGRHSVFAAVSIPLWQDFAGISNDEKVRVSLGYGVHFGSKKVGHHHASLPMRHQLASR